MSPPRNTRRGFFSLNVDTNADHILEKTVEKDKDEKDIVKIRQHGEPHVGNTSLQVLTKPFEQEIKRSVERIVDGRTVRDTETSYSNENDKPQRHTVKVGKRKQSLWEKYDTSDL